VGRRRHADNGRQMARLARRTALVALLLSLIAMALSLYSLVAHGDVGNMGPGPAPGLCSYPATCDVGEAGGVVATYWYREDWPVELNGTHRHCYYYGTATDANVGFSMVLQISATGPLGAMVGGCHYVCPDGQLGEFPNPVGGWKDAMRPARCKPIGPNPDMPVPISTPIAEQGAVPAIPFGQPQPPSPGAPGVIPPTELPPAEVLPSQTNPTCPNPAATTSKDNCQ
jgi:hypothetical protein